MRKTKLLLPVLLMLLCSALLLAGFSATAMTADEASTALQWEEYAVGSYDAEPTVTTAATSTEFDFTGYSIVCSGGSYMRSYAQKLADRLSVITGDTITVASSTSGIKRGIYIGQSTDVCQRALVKNNMSSTKCGYAVTVMGKNIALAGTNNFMAAEAIDYFIATYLSGENMDATIAIADNHTLIYDDADVITVLTPATKTYTKTYVTETKATVSESTTYAATGGSTIYTSVIFDQNLDHDATYNNDADPDTEYSKINMSYLKDTNATGYSLEKHGTYAYVLDTTHDNSSYKAGVISYDGDYILVNGNKVTVPEEYFNGSRGQTFSINEDGYVEIRNRGWFSSDYYTIGLQGLGSGVGTGNDYVYDRAVLVASGLTTLSGSTSSLVYADSTAATANEILVGKVAGRTEDDAVWSTLGLYEYAIAVVDGKIVLTGHSTETQQYAAVAFYEIMLNGLIGTSSTTKTTNGANTTETTVTTYTPVYLPNSYKAVGTSLTNWGANATTNYQKDAERISDALLPDLDVTDVSDANDGSIVVVYRSGATLDAFNTYCAELVAGGYTLITESTLSGSYFKTYVNYDNGITLAVSYCAFEGKSDYSVGQQWGTNMTEKYFAYSDPQIRVSVAHLASVDLPTGEILNSEQTYTKVTDSAITSLDMSVAYDETNAEYVAGYGTGYAMMLEDGRFILIDGGQALGGTDDGYDAWAQVDTIYNVLEDLYFKAFGTLPTSENPITIAAWILTHGHGDHTNAFWDFAHKYGAGDAGCGTQSCSCHTHAKRNNVVLQYLFTNSPARSIRYNAAESNETITLEMEKWQKYFGGFTYVKVHTGQIYYFANLTIEVLATVEDLYPQRVVTYNDTSNIMRLTFRCTTAADNALVTLNNADASDGVKKTSFISTGDIYLHTSRFVTSMYGSDLKADMVSMGHHGGPGSEAAFYDMVAPETIWWSMAVESVHGGYSTGTAWYYRIDQYVAYGSSYVKYIFVADAPTISGNTTVKAGNLTLYLTANGPDYENLYNAGDVDLDRDVDSTDDANRTIPYNSKTLPTFNGKNQGLTISSTYTNAYPVAIKRP